jgi:hypothetical protein
MWLQAAKTHRLSFRNYFFAKNSTKIEKTTAAAAPINNQFRGNGFIYKP